MASMTVSMARASMMEIVTMAMMAMMMMMAMLDFVATSTPAPSATIAEAPAATPHPFNDTSVIILGAALLPPPN